MKKILIILIFISTIILTGCSSKEKTLNLIDIGIQISVPSDMVVVYNNQTTFDYNGLKIPSVSVNGVTKNKNTLLTIKSFPFPAKDYMKHYRSAFGGDNIKEIKYDYNELKLSKNSIYESIYESKAVLRTSKGDKTSLVYVISFKNKIGTLIVQYTGNNESKFKKSATSIKLIDTKKFNVKKTGKKQSFTNLKKVEVIKGVNLSIPSVYEIKERVSPVSGTYYINLFGKLNDAIYLCISDIKPLPVTKSRWSMANATEIVKHNGSNNISDEFIVHNINNSHLYYLNTTVKEIKISEDEILYLRIDFIDKNNDKEFFKNLIDSLQY